MSAALPPATPVFRPLPAGGDAGLQSLLRLGADWYWEQDADFRFTAVFAPGARVHPDATGIEGLARWELPHAHALTQTWDEHRALLQRHQPFHDFQFSLSPPGLDEPLYVSVSGEPVFDADGRFRGYRGTSRDVSAHWADKSRLQDAQVLLRAAATLGRFGAWSIDVATGTTCWTEGLGALHRHGAADRCVEGLEVLRTYAPEHRDTLLRAYERCAIDGTPYDLEVEALTANGERFWVRIIGVAVRDHGGRIVRVQGAYQDIHRSKAAAEKHRQLAHRLRTTLESLTDGFATLDSQWRVTYANAAAYALLDLPPHSGTGRNLWELFPQARGTAFEENYRAAMERKEVRRFEAYYLPLGKWIRASAFPSEQGVAISFTDVTAARQARQHLERVNAELEERVRERTGELKRINDELAAFTLAVAHDLRAPLAGIGGFSRALAERTETIRDPKSAHYLDRIRAGVSRMEHLIEGLLELSRIGRTELDLRQVDLSAIAQDCIEALRAQPGTRAVRTTVQPGLRARGDARLLRTVLENLVGNAWKFTAAHALPAVEVGQGADGAFYVRDNGPGFDMAQAEEIFAPFTRLHADDVPGLGIGLASARRVVERHGGRIWAESSPGGGSTFWFTLP